LGLAQKGSTKPCDLALEHEISKITNHICPKSQIPKPREFNRFNMSSDESARGEPLLESLSRSQSPSTEHSGKRKRVQEDEVARKKTKKLRKSKKPKDINEDDLDSTLGVNLGIGRKDAQLLVDYVAQRVKRFKPKLSTVELEDLHLPGILSMLQDTQCEN
jgi:hypothetical protein